VTDGLHQADGAARVFAVATADDISQLPPELLRKRALRRDILRRPAQQAIVAALQERTAPAD
jgi:hypothetical protein